MTNKAYTKKGFSYTQRDEALEVMKILIKRIEQGGLVVKVYEFWYSDKDKGNVFQLIVEDSES